MPHTDDSERASAPTRNSAESAKSAKPAPQPTWAFIGALSILIGLGAVVRWQWQLASERDAARARDDAAQKQREDEAVRASTANKVKLAERRAELDAQLGKMSRIPTTTYAMGSDDHDNDEKPITSVTVPGFEIDVREVSTISFAACVQLGKCKPAGVGDGCNATRVERAAHPINCVTAEQAEQFCVFAGKRLPREEEWELAARGDAARLYSWGSTPPTDEDACWKRNDPAKPLGTCQVGEHAGRSAFGLVDVAGNVREWTSSAYCPYSRRDCDASSRALRGGAWSDTEASALRATVRSKAAPDTQSPSVGFRCARDALY